MQLTIKHLATTGSTNDDALELLTNNELHENLAILADVQTHGRGRLNGRLWISNHGNFHCSYIINLSKVGIQENDASILNSVALEVVRKFLTWLTGSKNSIEMKIPNDILICGKKVCGILVEVSYPYAIIGIGINLISSPIDCSTNIKDEFNLLVKPLELVENLYDALLAGITDAI